MSDTEAALSGVLGCPVLRRRLPPFAHHIACPDATIDKAAAPRIRAARQRDRRPFGTAIKGSVMIVTAPILPGGKSVIVCNLT